MFLQMHTLTSFHASLLNRDDAGLAKRIPFGDASRLRVSSQCLKRHWREALQNSIALPRADQTRNFFKKIADRLADEKQMPAELAQALAEEYKVLFLTKSGNSESESDSKERADNGDLMMSQPSIFGRPEQDYLVKIAYDCAVDNPWKESKNAISDLWVAITGKKKPAKKKKRSESEKAKLKENFKAMLRQAGHGNLYAGVEGALFGRFVTSDIFSRSDAAVHVAHAFTVHPLKTEVDYFTAIEQLAEKGETGAAHAGDMELGSGLFYEYVAVDIPLLVSNFTACEPGEWRAQDASEVKAVLRALLETIATVSPGAKLGATAPYARADFTLFESGDQQPRSLANAYLQSLQFRQGDNPMQQAVDALAGHLQAVDGMYGASAAQRVAATTQRSEALGDIPTKPLDAAIEETLNAIFGE